ncbi:unnamed protein product [Urochloa humidicola]
MRAMNFFRAGFCSALNPFHTSWERYGGLDVDLANVEVVPLNQMGLSTLWERDQHFVLMVMKIRQMDLDDCHAPEVYEDDEACLTSWLAAVVVGPPREVEG